MKGAIKGRSGRVWPAMVIGMIGVSLTVCALTIVAATTDPSFAVESDYYERAVRWDDTMEERRASEALGWACEIDVSGADAATGRREVSVRVIDAAGEPVDIDHLAALAFHHSRRGEASMLELARAGEGGWWRSSVEGGRDGWWQVRVRAARGSDVYVTTRDVRSADREQP